MAHAADPLGGAVGGVPWRGGGAVAQTTGRVFFTLDSTDYSCSASTVGGSNPDVVVTAAHCVTDGTGGWAVNWTFVPGYENGQEPYGSFPAKSFFVSSQWTDGTNKDNDVAFVDVGEATVGGVTRSVGDVVGSQPISFKGRTPTAAVFGYPAVAPYTGDELDYCAGPVSADPYGGADAGVACGMTEGDSGGPWLSSFDPGTGTGVITGVTSFKYTGQDSTLYSTSLGQLAQSLYNRAEAGRP